MDGQDQCNTTKKKIKVRIGNPSPRDVDELLRWFHTGVIKHDPTQDTRFKCDDGRVWIATKQGYLKQEIDLVNY